MELERGALHDAVADVGVRRVQDGRVGRNLAACHADAGLGDDGRGLPSLAVARGAGHERAAFPGRRANVGKVDVGKVLGGVGTRQLHRAWRCEPGVPLDCNTINQPWYTPVCLVHPFNDESYAQGGLDEGLSAW